MKTLIAGLASLIAVSLTVSLPVQADTEPAGVGQIKTYIDRVERPLPSNSQSLARSKKSAQRVIKRLKKKIKRARPKGYTSCTASTCYAYTYVAKQRCVVRILKKRKMVCFPWKRVRSSEWTNFPPDDTDTTDPDDNPFCDAGPTVCLRSGEPLPQPGSRAFVPGVNSIPDLGPPTGGPADYTYLFGYLNKFLRCDTSKSLYVRVNYSAIPAEYRAVSRTNTERAFQTIADKSGFTIVVQGDSAATPAEAQSATSNLNDDTDIIISYYNEESGGLLGRGGQRIEEWNVTGGYVQLRSLPPYSGAVLDESTAHDWYVRTESTSLYSTVLHEMGHALGLGHWPRNLDDPIETPDPLTRQIMHPMSSEIVYTQYQAGDRTALNNVGPRTSCRWEDWR